MKIAENIQKTICYATIEKREKKAYFPLKVFTLFFHPSAHVTAVGGAKKDLLKLSRFSASKTT